MAKLEKYIRTIPNNFDTNLGSTLNALCQALSIEDDEVSTQIENTRAQFFIRTATGRDLITAGANLGITNPLELALKDTQFQELIPNLSYKSKQIRRIFYDTMDVFWGPTFSRANTTSRTYEPFDLSTGDIIEITAEGILKIVEILPGEVATDGAATAEELTNILNKCDKITASVITDALLNFKYVNIRTNTTGLFGSLEVKTPEHSSGGTPQTEAWAVSGSLNIARMQLAGCGVQNAALSFGGRSTGNQISDETEKFNGTTWSVSELMSAVRAELAGCGTQDAALSFGGYGYSGVPVVATEEFDGTTWSASGDLNTARYSLAGCGTQDAALSFGGNDTNNNPVVTTEKYGVQEVVVDAWTMSGNLTQAHKYLAGCGTQDAGLSFGGTEDSTYNNITEKFNGTTWTTSGNLINNYYSLSGCGTQAAALSFGGEDDFSSHNITEKFNGTTWTTSGNLNTIRTALAGCGTQSAGLSFGGCEDPTFYATTEKFNGTTWSVSGNLNTAVYALAGCGTQTAALSFGGYDEAYAYQSITEKFNGTTWATSGNLNVEGVGLSGCGTQSAGLRFGGLYANPIATTEKFNGTTWTISEDLNVARFALAGCGTQTTALSFGGDSNVGASVATTEKFSQTTLFLGAWTTSSNLNVARSGLAGCGTQTAALSFGGYDDLNALVSTEKFNGTTWTNSGNLNTASSYLAGCGTQDGALSFGGGDTDLNAVATSEKFNGTTWSVSGDLNVARYFLAGAGAQSDSALSFGGNNYNPTTEKWVITPPVPPTTWRDFDFEKIELHQQPLRTVLYEVNQNEIIIELPALVSNLTRDNNTAHYFHADQTLESNNWKGHFFYDPKGTTTNISVSNIRCKLTADIQKNQNYTFINVDNAAPFIDQTGYLVFDWNLNNEESPIYYRSIPNTNTIVIDPTYKFKQNHTSNSYVNFINERVAHIPSITGEDLAIYFNAPVEARKVVQSLLNQLQALGVTITFVILAPEVPYLITNPYL